MKSPHSESSSTYFYLFLIIYLLLFFPSSPPTHTPQQPHPNHDGLIHFSHAQPPPSGTHRPKKIPQKNKKYELLVYILLIISSLLYIWVWDSCPPCSYLIPDNAQQDHLCPTPNSTKPHNHSKLQHHHGLQVIRLFPMLQYRNIDIILKKWEDRRYHEEEEEKRKPETTIRERREVIDDSNNSRVRDDTSGLRSATHQPPNVCKIMRTVFPHGVRLYLLYSSFLCQVLTTGRSERICFFCWMLSSWSYLRALSLVTGKGSSTSLDITHITNSEGVSPQERTITTTRYWWSFYLLYCLFLIRSRLWSCWAGAPSRYWIYEEHAKKTGHKKLNLPIIEKSCSIGTYCSCADLPTATWCISMIRPRGVIHTYDKKMMIELWCLSLSPPGFDGLCYWWWARWERASYLFR